MQSRKIAIIDLGTNTFHLLIVNVVGKGFDLLHKEKISVRIGKGGINKGFIAKDAENRALLALKSFRTKLDEYDNIEVFANATSAIRNAKNGLELTRKIEKETGIKIKIISGDEEAEYIYYGVKTALDIGERPALIMDIGGGSVEFIIGNRDRSLWKTSLEIGAQRLLDLFHQNDPIGNDEISNLTKYLDLHLTEVDKAVKKFKPATFIGCSGTFDTLSDIYTLRTEQIESDIQTELPLPTDDFYAIHEELIRKNKAERLKIPGMIALRVDMIVVASFLINHLLRKYKIRKIRISAYALKEGVLYNIIHKLNQ